MPVWVETINFDEGVGGGTVPEKIKTGYKAESLEQVPAAESGRSSVSSGAQDTAEVAKEKAELPHLLGKSRSPAG